MTILFLLLVHTWQPQCFGADQHNYSHAYPVVTHSPTSCVCLI